MDWRWRKKTNAKISALSEKTSNMLVLVFTIFLLLLLDSCCCASENGHCPHEIFQKTPGWNYSNNCVAIVRFTSKYDDIVDAYVETCKKYNHGTWYNISDLYQTLKKKKHLMDKLAKDMMIYLNFQIVDKVVSNNAAIINYTVIDTTFGQKFEVFKLINDTWTAVGDLNNSIPTWWVKKYQEKKEIKYKLCAVYHKNIHFVVCDMNHLTHVACIVPRIGECKVVNAEMDIKGCTYCKHNYLLPYCTQKRIITAKTAKTIQLIVAIAVVTITFLLILIVIYRRTKSKMNEILKNTSSVAAPAPAPAPVPAPVPAPHITATESPTLSFTE
ncbi:hypothetical protein T07_1341 [Trichinella nelsoni]|uniref:Uncharacterized protein n=1 Tax=Trichinella nelsoni TaxID=6336 RepID=A0A0V0SB35_9BILA|nr:hypothetical protein T07_1341 [Trichinella nelsoni]